MRKRTVAKKKKQQALAYPYIMVLDDGRRLVVDSVPATDHSHRLIAYELGPVDWVATASLNPDIVGRMVDVLDAAFKKLGIELPSSDGGKAP